MAYKTFADGDVFTASDVNTYLMRQSVIVCTSGTRPTSLAEGMVIHETDTDMLLVHDGSRLRVLSEVSGDQYIRKTATEAVTSSTTLQNDDQLGLAVAASGIYETSVMIRYDAAVAGDIKIGFSGPSGAAYDWMLSGLTPAAAAQTDDQVILGAIGDTATLGGLTVTTTCAAWFHGLYVGGGTAGTFQVRWAQGTSSPTSTRVFGGSFVTMRRLA